VQLGILTFLRRTQKTYATAVAPTPTISATPPSPATRDELPVIPHPTVDKVPSEPASKPFRSERYGYRLTLPAGWHADEPRSIAGSPPIDRFTGPGRAQVGVWTEACPLRTLPDVPVADRIGKFTLANGLEVPFAAFAPSTEEGQQFLEGRWLAQGKRWTMHAQVPSADKRTPMLATLGTILASLSIDG